MARGFNKVILMGNLTRDIEIRQTPGNQSVGSFGVAMNRQWRTPEGETREEVTFVDCEVWGKQAEVMKQYLAKGRAVFLEGRLKLDQWKDKNDGSSRSKLKVVVEEFRFVDGRGGGPGGEGSSGGGAPAYEDGGAPSAGGFDDAPARPARPPVRNGAPARSSAPQAGMDPDDIPF